MWAPKVKGEALSSRLRAPGRFCALKFEADRGVGDLLTAMLPLLPNYFDGMTEEARVAAGHQLINFDPDPEGIARACGIPTRYLHELFKDTGETVRSWIRSQRLAACHEALEDPGNVQTAAEIACRWGFGDQTQFSRVFKASFGMPPGEFRKQARLAP